MHGAVSLACLKRSRTREAPTPTNISTKSEPEMVKKGTSASPAIALASSVLPHPGGPVRSTPRGMRPPSLANLLGFLRNSMISCTSSLASSTPATSLKVTPVISLPSTRCLLFPKLPSIPPPPPALRSPREMKNQSTSTMRMSGPKVSTTGQTCDGFREWTVLPVIFETSVAMYSPVYMLRSMRTMDSFSLSGPGRRVATTSEPLISTLLGSMSPEFQRFSNSASVMDSVRLACEKKAYRSATSRMIMTMPKIPRLGGTLGEALPLP